ncbi:predicted protein [Sclerotinia sclerotiorum 1980 UF-70]|uniref:Uncharacterized protein n=1 Tax=Sclerotinia sclerotiorum (strain ATCC 18683 / 1980 / Ss-1) TaxID=665079 RepID=A7EHT1_SCLS1|nr:predicted protein [Sclerotinia sclerotiorum 1980 UF-70]EDO02397.1 predicted protein [Sclerotinia sclerotiorum 1980 UF-70]
MSEISRIFYVKVKDWDALGGELPAPFNKDAAMVIRGAPIEDLA